MRQSTLFARNPDSILANFRTLMILFDKDRDKTLGAIEQMPALLTYSQERNFIHWVYRQITGKKPSLGYNPMRILAEHFKKVGNEEGFQLLKRALERFTEMSRKERAEKNQGDL